MKKLFLIGASLFSILTAQSLSAGLFGFGGGGCNSCCQPSCCPTSCCQPCGDDCGCPCDQPVGDCICKYVRYQPSYYSTTHCYQEAIPCSKTCCQMVPQYYEVQRCRYVPQYYSVTCCRQVPQYYQVPYNRYVTRTYCQPHVRYIPTYYWKRECRPTCEPCGFQGGCEGVNCCGCN